MSRARVFHLALCALAACGGQDDRPARDSGAPAHADGGSEGGTAVEDAAAEQDAETVDAGPGRDDGGVPALCDPDNFVPDGCEDLSGLDEGSADRCDGYDNDCNGLIDDGCACVDGSVQECFDGPPGRADIGACRRGTQVCSNAGEFGGWGNCKRGISPSEEVCDRLDNDCNGCVDEREDCDVFIDCPGEGDPRIPPGKPFEDYQLDASKFYNGNDVASWKWSVAGSPCDELYASIPNSNATDTSGRLSYKLTNAQQKMANVRFTLSGTYLVSLTIVRKSGQELSCTFPVIVGATGLRVELCWDKTGPTAGANFVDLDLHLAMKGQTVAWNDARDFYYDNFTIPQAPAGTGIWNHPNTPDNSGCMTGGGLDIVHDIRGNCINPRLDIDNQGDSGDTDEDDDTLPDLYLPENINLDNPRKDEVFQVSVNHFDAKAVNTRALVNVFCGGNLRGSFSLDPTQTPFSNSTVKTEFWHVVEVAPQVNDAGTTTDCTLTPLHPAGSDQGALVTEGDFSITWSE